jgi:hypothetical protein
MCTRGLNFDPVRPLRDILEDYKRILERVFDPAAYAGRLDRLVAMLDRTGRPRELPPGDPRRQFSSIEGVHRIISELPQTREPFWRTFINCAKSNPAALRYIVMLMAMYLHLGPYSRHVIGSIEHRLAVLDREAYTAVVAAE